MNRSREESDEYFAEGLADELLNVLSKIRGLKVAARTSSFQFKGRGEDLEIIGRRLNVATLLDGSVRKPGNRVRTSVYLLSVAEGYHLWSETHDRTLDDIFAVQDDIAQSVVKELRTTLLGDEADSRAATALRVEVAKAGRGRARNPEAHRLYLQGRYFLDRRTRAGTSKGIQYFHEALALEPDFALAWAMLGQARTREVDSGWATVAEGLPLARQAIDRALSLEPDLAEAHAGRGRLGHDVALPTVETAGPRVADDIRWSVSDRSCQLLRAGPVFRLQYRSLLPYAPARRAPFSVASSR